MEYFRVRIVTKGSRGDIKTTTHKYGDDRSAAKAHIRKIEGRSYTVEACLEIFDVGRNLWLDYYSKKVSPAEQWDKPYIPPSPYKPLAKMGSIEEAAEMDLSFELNHSGVLAS